MSLFFYISIVLLFIVVLRFLIALLNFLTRPILNHGKVTGNPLVSILIPARNEEENIGKVLTGLQQQDYKNLEIIVYNDLSTDTTPEIVKDFSRIDNRINLIDGVDLPEGWLGKNHACYKLAQRAKGEYLLFIDADVKVAPHFVGNATSYMQRKRLSLLSMFPRQEMETLGERIVVPNMNWILLSLLFLRLVRWSKRRSLAAANGQMMMFYASDYNKNQWHEKLKSSPVEDIGISRLIKRKKMRMATLLGSDDISCRMYNSYNESINGFTKNVAGFFGGSNSVALIFAIIGTFGPLLVLFTLPFPLTLLFFFCLLSARMLVAQLSEQSPFTNVILWPIQHFAFVHMIINSIRWKRKGSLSWKGRKIS